MYLQCGYQDIQLMIDTTSQHHRGHIMQHGTYTRTPGVGK
jgi:hypothetical protein